MIDLNSPYLAQPFDPTDYISEPRVIRRPGCRTSLRAGDFAALVGRKLFCLDCAAAFSLKAQAVGILAKQSVVTRCGGIP